MDVELLTFLVYTATRVLWNLSFSNTRSSDKDRTDIYASGVTQRNILNYIKSIGKMNLSGNSSYSSNMIAIEKLFVVN